MEDKELEQKSKIAIFRDPSLSEAIVKDDTKSDIERYKEVLGDRFLEAKLIKIDLNFIYF